MTRVVAIIQARMSSQRLPNKVLLPLPSAEDPNLRVLDWVVRRTLAATLVDAVVIATSTDTRDDPLVAYCDAAGYLIHRGSLNDVLGRFVGTIKEYPADVVVRITADCPLTDPAIIDLVISTHLSTDSNFTANRLPPPHERSYPIGLDVEAVSAKDLLLIDQLATDQAQREHVLPYFYENRERFKITILEHASDAGGVRWTIDTPDDYEALTQFFRVSNARLDTPWTELLAVWRSNPHLAEVNSAVRQRSAAERDPRLTEGQWGPI